jgi:RNA polymerase sigma-70 factor (ECF subfamily)
MMSVVMQQRSPGMLSAVAGDPSSFSGLIEPLLDPAFRLAAVMLADRAAAEDAVQEASIKAWRKLRQLRGDERSLRPWFLSIVANECRMARRQRWWSVVRLAEPPRAEDTTDHYSGGAGDVRRALLRLKPEDRLPLVLHFYLDLPLDEVARTLGVSEPAAKSRIYRAAQRLRPELSMEEVF